MKGVLIYSYLFMCVGVPKASFGNALYFRIPLTTPTATQAYLSSRRENSRRDHENAPSFFKFFFNFNNNLETEGQQSQRPRKLKTKEKTNARRF